MHSYAKHMGLNRKCVQIVCRNKKFDFFFANETVIFFLTPNVSSLGLFSWFNGLNVPSIVLFMVYIPFNIYI